MSKLEEDNCFEIMNGLLSIQLRQIPAFTGIIDLILLWSL